LFVTGKIGWKRPKAAPGKAGFMGANADEKPEAKLDGGAEGMKPRDRMSDQVGGI